MSSNDQQPPVMLVSVHYDNTYLAITPTQRTHMYTLSKIIHMDP